jgi:hypothetical protein
MKNKIATISLIICIVMSFYFLVFFSWLVFMFACIDHAEHNGYEGSCGQDDFSKVIQKTHAPVITILKNYEKK